MKTAGNPTLNVGENESAGVSPIETARAYVRNLVQVPALASGLPAKFKRKIKHADLWLRRFKRVGDLLAFLERYKIQRYSPVYMEMKKFNLLTFEDIISDFSARFAQWDSDSTRITDFVIGEHYSVFDILTLARNYETRSGGMFVLNADGVPAAVIIKATLEDGPYPNEWLDEPRILKYYLKSIKGKFGEHFKPNRAIIENPNIPIVTFTRARPVGPFIFRGIFRCGNILREIKGGKAFVLTRCDSEKQKVLSNSIYVEKHLQRAVSNSMKEPRDLRLRRLATAAAHPKSVTVTATVFDRNPDVIAEVLHRASGVCEECRDPAPFVRRSDGTPYLEVHHRILLSAGGADTVANAMALCPNCHRRSHYGLREFTDIDQLDGPEFGETELMSSDS